MGQNGDEPLMGHAEYAAMRMKTDQNTTLELIVSYCKGLFETFFMVLKFLFHLETRKSYYNDYQ